MSYNNHITSISSSKYILGDSLIELKKFKDHSVDMVFCDPPYNLQLSKTLYRPDATKFRESMMTGTSLIIFKIMIFLQKHGYLRLKEF